MNYQEFLSKMQGGESRQNPSKAVSYVLIEEQGKEIFYKEWDFISENNDFIEAGKAYHEYLKLKGVEAVCPVCNTQYGHFETLVPCSECGYEWEWLKEY